MMHRPCARSCDTYTMCTQLFIYDYKLISSAKSGAELKTIAQLKDSPNTWNHEFSYFRVKKKEVKKKELACNHAR